MKQFFGIFGLLLVLGFNSADASKPKSERSEESCKKKVQGIGSRGTDYISSSALIPWSQLMGTKYCMQIAKNYVLGEMHERQFPTQGLAQMFMTARTAADSLVSDLKIKTVRPQYHPRDLIAGAEQTVRLMLEAKPEYIREGILIRDGVLVVVPLLKRVDSGKKGGKPLYAPIVVKGHQELEKFDILGAAFAAWALGPYLGKIPESALVHLKPMVEQRKPKGKMSSEDMYLLDVEDHLPEVNLLHQNYLKTISDEKKLAAVQPRRCVQCNVCPWAAHCRTLMNASNDLSMMPYAPKKPVADRFGELKLGTMVELGELDVNGSDFVKASVYAGVDPERMKYFVAHAKAKVKDTPILLDSYTDPFAEVSKIVHIDFEDVLDRNVKSGVYLFGVEIENARHKTDKKFIFADTLDQEGVDNAWAEFLRLFKSDPVLRKGDYKVTIYSHHEIAKFHQEFDILEEEAHKFTAKQKSSPFYSEITVEAGRPIDADQEDFSGAPKEPKVMGRLIRNADFFKKYRDIKPGDIFAVLDRMIDLLDYTRWNFAFPTASNGLKFILPYMNPAAKLQLTYPEGWNGLESVAWAKKAYETGEHHLLDQIREYNEIDIDSNLVATRFIRQSAEKTVETKLRWSAERLKEIDSIRRASRSTALVYRIEEQAEMLQAILGRSVSDLSDTQLDELRAILDRQAYLAERKEVNEDDGMSPKEKEQKLQHLEYEKEKMRKQLLIEFFQGTSDFSKKDKLPDEVTDRVAELFLYYPTNYLLPSHLDRIVVFELMQKSSESMKANFAKDPIKRLRPSDRWITRFKSLLKKIPETFSQKRAAQIWYGIYCRNAFGRAEK